MPAINSRELIAFHQAGPYNVNDSLGIFIEILFMRPKKIIFILITILSGLLLLSPFLNYDDIIAQGDHGRDFYCFRAASRGEIPYRDFWWVYGPLMPYYYAVFLKIFGISIKSILWGHFALYVLCGLIIFLMLSPFIPLTFAYIAALWSWTFGMDFFYTYNHIGGVFFLLTTMWALAAYIRKGQPLALWGGALSIFLLCFIKINFGICAFIVFTMMVYIKDKLQAPPVLSEQKLFYSIMLLILPLCTIIIYLLLIKDLPAYAFKQCFPYLAGDHPHHAEPLTMIATWWTSIALTINADWPNRIFFVLLLTSIVKTFLILKEDRQKLLRHPVVLMIISLFFFYVINLHEFLVSGVLYRTFWSQIFSIPLIFLFIGFTAKQLKQSLRRPLWMILILIVILNYSNTYQAVRIEKNPAHYLDLKHAQVYLGNTPSWITAVKETTEYLQSHLREDETFFALPYDPIYYFLTDRRSPTRQLIFFEHINIPPEQEEKILEELEQKKVNWVALSSRFFDQHPGMGILGKTYCPLIGSYLKENFKVEKVIGNWRRPAGWVHGHGVRILKRNTEKDM